MEMSEFDRLYQKTKERFTQLEKRGAVDPNMASKEGYIFRMYCEELAKQFSGKKTAAYGKPGSGESKSFYYTPGKFFD